MAGLENMVLGHYHLRHLLGHGGMAEVYLAYDELLKREVAVKVIDSSNREYVARFHREGEMISQLSHDHILPAFDHGDQDSWHFLVMPYIKHATLRERLVEGPLGLQEVGEILFQIADALQFAHDHGIIHRDIKPSNILLRDDHYVYLADFGLAKSLHNVHGLTLSGILLGTPEYMAPDLAYGTATKSCDIYALGALLYQMLTGVVPFSAETPLAVYMKHLHEQPLPPSVVNPTLPATFDAIVLQALAKNPHHRFTSAHALSAAYQHVLHSLTLATATEASEHALDDAAILTRDSNATHRREQTLSRQWAIPLSDREGPAQLPTTPTPIISVQHHSTTRTAHRTNITIISLVSLGVLLFIVLPMTTLYYLYTTTPHQLATTAAIVHSVNSPLSTQSLPTSLMVTPLIADNLVNNNAGRWAVNATCSFGQEGYQVSATQTNVLQLCPLLTSTPLNETVQVDVLLLSGHEAGIALYFSSSRFYAFEITEQRQFLFRRHDSKMGTGYVDLIPPTNSTRIAVDGQTNTLTLFANAGTFQLFINGIQVGTVHDATESGGQVALVAGTRIPQQSAVASFTHFLLARIGQ